MNLLKACCAVLLSCVGFVTASADAQNIAGTYVGTYTGTESGTVTITIGIDNRTVQCIFSDNVFYGATTVVQGALNGFGIGCNGATVTDAWAALGASTNTSGATSIQGTWTHATEASLHDGTWVATLSSNGAFAIGPGITGSWFDPSQSGHGFAIEVLPETPVPQLLVYWFAFAPYPVGGTTWIWGAGPINGNQAVISASQVAGPGGFFPPNFDPSQVSGVPWGTITFTFTDCTNGIASWQPTVAGYTAGTIPITRLTLPAGLTCP
jgi:hypothetical protein